MSNDIPVSTIKEQAITDTPTNGDATIMDDTVMTMDGSGLMGGPVTVIESIQSVTKPDELFTKIPRSS